MDIIKGLFPKITFANWKKDTGVVYLILTVLVAVYFIRQNQHSNDTTLDTAKTMCKEQNESKNAEIKRLNDRVDRLTLGIKEMLEINAALQGAKTANDIIKEAK